ncbi:hypothetical protein HD554DRAFT_2079525 [Boletus coccyginus]|nr:hypothetical protein HD554DRAFT_2079525 [Boletus coccyginus]
MAGRLSICKVPRKSVLEEYRQHGLLVSDDGEQDIEFLISWSMNDIDSWLRCLLPKPFEWLDARLDKPAKGSFHWALLNSERQKYFVLTRPTITGKELDEVKGSAGRKFTAFSVVVAPRINIPQSVFTDWDRSISQALNGSPPVDEVSDMSDAESEIVDPFDLDNAPGCNDDPNTADSESASDDDFFFTKLIARESELEAAATGSKRPRRVSLSELATSESQPSAGKRIKSENYHITRGLGVRNEASDEVAEAGPSGSGMATGLFTTRRSTTVRPPDSPSRNPWK